MGSVFEQVTVLFLIILIGYIARKKRILTGELNKGLSNVLLYITLPLQIIYSFNKSFSQDMLNNSLIIFIIAVITHTVSVILGLFIFKRYPEDKVKVLRYITIFSNCGFMGYPVLKGIFGDAGIFYGSIYNIPFTILMWTVGITIFNGKSEGNKIKKAIINPGIIATIMGFTIFMFSISLPSALKDTLNSVGSMTTPLSMIIIGSALAETRIRDIFNEFSIYYVTFLRLILLPLVTLLVLRLIGIQGIPLVVSVVLVGMPAAANTVVFSEKYDGDSVFASKAIFVSTILSMITIPIMVLLTR